MSSIENHASYRSNAPETLRDYYTLNAINGLVTALYCKNAPEEVSFDDWSAEIEAQFRTNWQGQEKPSAQDFLSWLESKQAIDSQLNDSRAKLRLVRAA